MERKLIIKSAQGWYDAAFDTTYTPAERLLSMENALNHTENALAEAIKILRDMQKSQKCENIGIFRFQMMNRILEAEKLLNIIDGGD